MHSSSSSTSGFLQLPLASNKFIRAFNARSFKISCNESSSSLSMMEMVCDLPFWFCAENFFGAISQILNCGSSLSLTWIPVGISTSLTTYRTFFSSIIFLTLFSDVVILAPFFFNSMKSILS